MDPDELSRAVAAAATSHQGDNHEVYFLVELREFLLLNALVSLL